ncbi:MAG: hypothetical protein KDA51_04755, partial [Planctomycetales bacterium]|nr:hypothetical protein [Planctomycetales bacterium]
EKLRDGATTARVWAENAFTAQSEKATSSTDVAEAMANYFRLATATLIAEFDLNTDCERLARAIGTRDRLLDNR